MYAALAIVPSLIGIVPYLGATVFGVDVPPAAGLGFAATIAPASPHDVNYTNLQNATILTGQCPCCEEPIKQFFGGENRGDERGLQVPGVRHRVQAGPRRDEDQGGGWPQVGLNFF